MRQIGAAITEALRTGGGLERYEPAALPEPSSLSADAATQLGSELLAGGAFDQALPYLAGGLRSKPNAFGWCRLGKLCRDQGHPEWAVQCYDEALVLEPGSPFAILGRAGALTDCFDASLHALIACFEEVMDLLRRGDSTSPAAWTAYSVMKAIARRISHPQVAQCVRDLRGLAESLDSRTSAMRQESLERELDRVLRVKELLGDETASSSLSVPSRADVAAGAQPRVLPRRTGGGRG